MKQYKFVINGNEYEVSIQDVDDHLVDVDVNGTHYKVEVDKQVTPQKTPKLIRPAAVPSTEIHEKQDEKRVSLATPARSVGASVVSPLPGVILEIMVKEGDKVIVGQRLLILEAMKMENNIDSDKEGVISSIKIGKGDSVQQGDLLMIIS
jgi:glutaconyl-CoA/methylmalonyl-CoA decarboxylase subunit gamma